MGKIQDNYQDIADEIKDKSGSSDPLSPLSMPTAIRNLPSIDPEDYYKKTETSSSSELSDKFNSLSNVNALSVVNLSAGYFLITDDIKCYNTVKFTIGNIYTNFINSYGDELQLKGKPNVTIEGYTTSEYSPVAGFYIMDNQAQMWGSEGIYIEADTGDVEVHGVKDHMTYNNKKVLLSDDLGTIKMSGIFNNGDYFEYKFASK